MIWDPGQEQDSGYRIQTTQFSAKLRADEEEIALDLQVALFQILSGVW